MTGAASHHRTAARRYHHGDLHRVLLEAGMELVREGGTEAVSLRAVARRAEVSHAAPYHHFRDKAALVEALAVEAFRIFTRTLRGSWESADGSPLERLGALGTAYVRFALDHPFEFRLMHLPGLRQMPAAGGASPVSGASAEAFGVLVDAIKACQEPGLIPEGDPEPFALTAWSTVHGLAVLLLDGLLDGYPFEAQGGELAGLVTRTLGRGLMSR